MPDLDGQRALPISDLELRDEPQYPALHGSDADGAGHQARRDDAQRPAHETVSGHEPEEAVCEGDQPARDGQPLHLVSVEQPRWHPALLDGRELPRQVVRVLDSGVHPLPAGRAVDVRRVAGEEHAPLRSRVATRWCSR